MRPAVLLGDGGHTQAQEVPMIFWPIVALVTVLLLVGAVRYGQPALEQRKHAKTLANIARLEIELGIVQAPLDRVTAWQQGVLRAMAPIVVPQEPKGVYNRCEFCQRRVQLDVGRCRLPEGTRHLCARFLYQRNESGPA